MDEINKHINPAAKIKREEAIFVWLDILGFSKELEDDRQYEELKRVLVEFHRLFDNRTEYEAFIISDGIILHIREATYENFIKIIKEIGLRQSQFIQKNKRFIRGGISVGSRFQAKEAHKKDIQRYFISNGLTRAVKLESRYVDWPVIGTDKKTIKAIQELFNINDEEETFSLLRSFNTNGNDLYFIDFLEQSDQNYLELLNSKIVEFEDDAEVRNKYIWLMKYYRHKCSDMIIPEHLMGAIL